MINKFLNKFNLAVILLAMAFAMDAQGQHFKTDSIYCYYVNFNRTDYTQDKTIPVYTYVSDIVLYRPDDALKRFAKFSIAAGEATADDGFTFIMRDKQQYDKSHEPGYSYIDRNERIHITKKATLPADWLTTDDIPKILEEPKSSKNNSSSAGLTIKEGSYNTDTKAAVERVTLAMKQQKAEEKIKSMASAAKSAKLQAETDRLIKLQVEKMKLRGRRQ